MTSVLHICQRDDAATGGAARVAVELVKRLPAQGIGAHCVFVYGSAGPFGAELGERAFHLGLRNGRDALFRLYMLRNLIVQLQPQILHHHDGLTWTHWNTKETPNATRVGHGHLPPPAPEAGRRGRFANWVHRRTYDHLICVSHATAQDWSQSGYPLARISVVANGVDTERFRPPLIGEREALRASWQLPNEAKVIGFVGRLHSAVKGCDDLLRILAALPENYVVVLAGSGPDEIALRAFAKQLRVHERVRFLGTVDASRSAFWGFDLFAMTSRFETFGLVLLEATACGVRTVVLPAAGGILDLAREVGATLLPTREPAAVAKSIFLMTSREAEAEDMAGRSFLEKYSWEAATKAIAHTYKSLLVARTTVIGSQM